MKDRFALLLAALVRSGAASAFWHWAGADAANIIGIIVIVSLMLENRSLRARLRRMESRSPQ